MIGTLTILLFTLLFVQVFFKLINENFDWWYVLIGVLLLVPLFIGVGFIIYWMAEESNSTRARLTTACILTIISVLLLAFWNCIYIVYVYKQPEILTEVQKTVTKKRIRHMESISWNLRCIYLGLFPLRL